MLVDAEFPLIRAEPFFVCLQYIPYTVVAHDNAVKYGHVIQENSYRHDLHLSVTQR